MSSGPPVAKVYKISNTWQQGLYLSSENLLGGPITGNRSAIGGIQAWQLAFEDSFATFQGVSPSKERKGYIAVDSTGKKLVYTQEGEPSKFILERLSEEYPDVYMVKVVNEDGSQIPPIGWQLPSGDDGTPVRIANVLIEGGEWRFTEYKVDEE